MRAIPRAPGFRRADAGRVLLWTGCLALVLGVHAGVVAVVLNHAPLLPFALEPAPEAVMLDLTPDAPPNPAPEPIASPPPVPDSVPLPPPLPELPVPEPPRAEPPPPEPPPVRAPDVVLPPEPPLPPRPVQARPPPPRAVARPTPPRPAMPEPLATSPAPPAPPAPAASVAPAAPASPSGAVPAWRGELVARLLRAKRYPDMARSRGEQGTAYVTFTMDRGGHVLSASVTRASGSAQLDEEAVAMIRRAEPLPAMPAEIPGATITLTVPVAFALR